MEEKADKKSNKSRGVGQVIERDGMTDDNTKALADGESQAHEDPMAQLAAALREILKDLPPRQVRRVGFGWWDELQGREPDESDFYESDSRSLRDLFDRCVDEFFDKKRKEKIGTGEAEFR